MFGNNYDPVALTKRNNGYTKAFLSNPITVILAIIYAISGILAIVSFSDSAETFSYTTKYLSEDYGLLVFILSVIRYTSTFAPVIIAIALFALYVQSLDRSPDKTPLFGLNTFLAGATVTMISYITISCLLIYIIVELINTLSEYSRYIGSASSEATTLLIVLFALDAIFTIYAFSIIRFASSLKTSSTSPSLSANGAGAFGVSSLLIALATIISIAYISEQMGDYSELLGTSTEFSFSTIISISTYILSGVFALFYKNRITNAGVGGVNIPETNNYAGTPTGNTTPYYTGNSSQNTNNYTPSADNIQTHNERTEPTPSYAYCPTCGSPADEAHAFCAACGAKLK